MAFINNFTGEIYSNLGQMVSHTIRDMLHYKPCRTFKMLNISRFKA